MPGLCRACWLSPICIGSIVLYSLLAGTHMHRLMVGAAGSSVHLPEGFISDRFCVTQSVDSEASLALRRAAMNRAEYEASMASYREYQQKMLQPREGALGPLVPLQSSVVHDFGTDCYHRRGKPIELRVPCTSASGVTTCDLQLTIVLMTYKRNEALQQVMEHYMHESYWPYVRKLLVVWNNVGEKLPRWLRELPSARERFQHHLGATGRNLPPEVEVVQETFNTLNNRYAHADRIPTEAVLLQDDDLRLCEGLLRAALAQQAEPSLRWRIGTPHVRAHRPGRYIPRRERNSRKHPPPPPPPTPPGVMPQAPLWAYKTIFSREEIKRTPFSLSTGQANVVHRDYIELFHTHTGLANARQWIDTHRPTCEDITLNFLATNLTGLAPLLLDVNRRGDDNVKCMKKNIKGSHDKKGMSLTTKHWGKLRSDCLVRLQEDFGNRMPLRYSCDRLQFC